MPSAFVFTTLPHDTRVMIYKLAFVSDKPISVSSRLPENETLSAHLLWTCKTCYEEGSAILYRENFFSMVDHKAYMDSQKLQRDPVRHFIHFGKDASFIQHIQAH